MAIESRNSPTWLLSLKIMLISSGVLSTAMLLKVSVPVVLGFVIHEVPLLWSLLLSWLRPPYLYIVINCIILTIVASSKLQSKAEEEEEEEPSPAAMAEESVKDPNRDVRTDYSLHSGVAVPMSIVEERRSEFAAMSPLAEYKFVGGAAVTAGLTERQMPANDAFAVVNGGGDEGSIFKSPEKPRIQTDSVERSPSAEKPLVTARFNHRRSVKGSPEGGKTLLLGVSKPPKRQDTLESTWKTITEGRPMPLNRHLKKSDTWESHARHNAASTMDQKLMKKSETFSDRSTCGDGGRTPGLTRSPGSGKLRKEASLGQDELNRRVEAFIKKFNEEMRLQRQESLQQYHEMISRGAH